MSRWEELGSGGFSRCFGVGLSGSFLCLRDRSSFSFERFTFANGAVSEGLTRRNYNEEVPDTSKPQVHQRTELVLLFRGLPAEVLDVDRPVVA